jgi:hypothetical protein
MRTRALIVAGLLAGVPGLGLAGCTGSGDHPRADTGRLTPGQYAAAVNLARHEIENQDAEVTRATAVIKHNAGPGAPSNTGVECTGDQVLRVRLIGTFPHITTGGTPGSRPGPVTELDIKADPDSGQACLIGVGTARHPQPDAGATVLQLDD